MKRMKHPEHGFHHAYNSVEEEAMRKNGWIDDDPEPVKEEVKEVSEEPRQKRAYNRKVA